jgi:hypothetical protein
MRLHRFALKSKPCGNSPALQGYYRRVVNQRFALDDIKLRLESLRLTVWAVHQLHQFWRSRQYLRLH